jgi:hypothetical protein
MKASCLSQSPPGKSQQNLHVKPLSVGQKVKALGLLPQAFCPGDIIQ